MLASSASDIDVGIGADPSRGLGAITSARLGNRAHRLLNGLRTLPFDSTPIPHNAKKGSGSHACLSPLSDDHFGYLIWVYSKRPGLKWPMRPMINRELDFSSCSTVHGSTGYPCCP